MRGGHLTTLVILLGVEACAVEQPRAPFLLEAPAPVIRVSPTELDFGSFRRGAENALELEVENAGAAVLLVEEPLKPDVVRLSAAFPLRVSANDSQRLTVQPAEEGPRRFDEVLELRSNDPVRPAILVRVFGEVLPEPPCRFDVWPAERVRFGDVGGTRMRSLRIRNLDENQPCFVRAALEGPEARAFEVSGLPDVLPASSSARIAVRFDPKQAGAATARLRLSAQAGSSAFELDLLGNAVASEPVIVPREVSFGEADIGCREEARTTIINIESEDLVLDSVTLEQVPSAPFGLMQEPWRPLTRLQSGEIRPYFEPREPQLAVGAARLDFRQGGRRFAEYIDLWGLADFVVDEFGPLSRPPVTFLFVIDNSPSMADHRASLLEGFRRFYRALSATDRDFILAVTTADTSSGGAAGRILPLGEGQRLVGRDAEDEFLRNVDVGSAGWEVEQPLEAAYLAVGSLTLLRREHNRGLVSRGITAVVFVTDASDQSPRQLDFYLNAYISTKGFCGQCDRWIPLSAVLMPEGVADTCPGVEPEVSTDVEGPVDRMPFETLARHGTIVSLCDARWPDRLFTHFEEVYGLGRAYALRKLPEVDSVLVSIEGVELPADAWRFDPDKNEVVIEPEYAATTGQVVRIRYAVRRCR